jgi:hypothetical protein
MWRCPSCGIVNSKDPVCNYCRAPAPSGAAIDSPSSEWSVWQWIRFLRWVLAGVLSLAIGVWLMVDPSVRQNPKEFTLSDIGPGLAACLVGAVILGLSYLMIRRRRKG